MIVCWRSEEGEGRVTNIFYIPYDSFFPNLKKSVVYFSPTSNGFKFIF